jgi:hypothetical protein
VRASLGSDGRPRLESLVSPPVARPVDPDLVAHVGAVRETFPTEVVDPALPTSSTHWAILAADEAMSALLRRRRRRPGTRPTDGVISFTVIEREVLPNEQPFRTARGLRGRAQEAFIEGRRSRCEAAHRSTIARLRRDRRVYGVTVNWMTEGLHVIADADVVYDVARWPSVERISPNAEVRSASNYGGIATRYVTGTADEIEAGNRGQPATGERIHVQIIDNGQPFRFHAAFSESGTDDTSRFTLFAQCNQRTGEVFGIPLGYECGPNRFGFEDLPQVPWSHSTIFSHLIGGSIEEDQVPGISAQDLQRDRSGQASEVDFQFFEVDDCDAIGRALGSSVNADVTALGVISTEATDCNAAYDCGDVQRILGEVAAGGPPIVVPAGNVPFSGTPAACRMLFPSYLPGVVAVGAYDNSTTVPLDYEDAPVAAFSPAGGAPIVVTSRSPSLATRSEMMGLVAPGFITLYPAGRIIPGTGGALDPTFFASGTPSTLGFPQHGTSWATGIVAGGIALQTAAFRDEFGAEPRGGVALALALASSDRWAPTTGVHRQALQAPDRQTGFGRYRAISPLSLPNSTFVFRSGVFSTGTTTDFPVVDEGRDDLVDVRWVVVSSASPGGAGTRSTRRVFADFVLEAIDACAPEGERVITEDLSFNLRKHIYLDRDRICPPNDPGACRCLTLRVTALAEASLSIVEVARWTSTEGP